MPIPTTCIGAWPKPDWLPIRDWFQTGHAAENYVEEVIRGYERAKGADALFDRATREAVEAQVACGIDVPTDGEQRRENYIHYQCRHFTGFDFENLERRELRNGAYAIDLPAIRGPVRAGEPVLPRDWRIAQEAAPDRPVKITLPGPMTISDTTADCFYGDARRLAFDLAAALNVEVRALAEAGCRVIQIDEPVFARKPDEALDYGIQAIERCWHGVNGGATRVLHACCGYPNTLDDEDYPKADPSAYHRLAPAVDGLVDQFSLEDAHRPNDLSLFEKFTRTKLIVGFVDVARSRIEEVDAVEARMRAVAGVLRPGQLIAAPDCGLGFFSREQAMAKLRVLTEAARRL